MASLLDALRLPARNRCLCGVLTLLGVLVLAIEGRVLPSRGMFLLVALPTLLAFILVLLAVVRAPGLGVERGVARFLAGAGVPVASETAGATLLSTLLYCGGVLGAMFIYGYLALVPANAVAPGDESFRWGMIDKRPEVFGYVFVAAFIAFHWLTLALHSTATSEGALAAGRSRLERVGGGVLAGALAFVIFGLPPLREVAVVDSRRLAPFFEVHSHVHLGALEQIRLGAAPYLEAITQYGLGNQLLMYGLTRAIDFSNHGFHAAIVLIAIVCIVLFFVSVQQFLGIGWALAGMVGWMLWPAPPIAVDLVPGWAILTRWVVVPILALALARLLLVRTGARGATPGWGLAGALWGLGGFLGQETLSGGFLVLALGMALFAPIAGWRVSALARAGGVFLASGAIVFLVLTASAVGVGHVLDAWQIANGRSGLVAAGVSNSFWSTNLEWSVGFRTINGWREDFIRHEGGDVRPLFQTYGFALLLMLVLWLVARALGRQFATLPERDRQFLWKYAGIVVGAYVMHLFTLLRADVSHLAAPSFLLPLVVAALPVFAWRFSEPGFGRSALLILAVALFAEAIVAGRANFGRRVDDIAASLASPGEIAGTYAALVRANDRSQGLAERYSPLAGFQAGLLVHPDYPDSRELFALLHDRLKGRRLEVGFYRAYNGLIESPEVFYFFGGFRSITGMTSPLTGIWLRSEEKAWIERVANAPGCVFFGPTQREQEPLLAAWKGAAAKVQGATIEEIAGRRVYGTLACKG